MDFLDVGQADCAIIRHRDKVILVDTGPKFYNTLNISRKILLPTLHYYGINKIDYLIITHFDSDHDGNLMDILNTMKVSNLVYPSSVKINKIETNQKNEKMNFLPLCRQNKITLDNLELDFLNNCNKQNGFGKNNNSVVFNLNYNKFSVLFTGDIEKEAEEELSSVFKKSLVSSVIKVAHHGSKTSSEDYFLSNVKPKISIISAGKNNRYNHPHPTILNKLKSISTVFQTNENGSILIEIGKTLKVSPYLTSSLF